MGLRLGVWQLYLWAGPPLWLYLRLVGVVLAVLRVAKVYLRRLFRVLRQQARVVLRLVARLVRPVLLPLIPLNATVVVGKRVCAAQNRKFVGQFVV